MPFDPTGWGIREIVLFSDIEEKNQPKTLFTEGFLNCLDIFKASEIGILGLVNRW